MCSFRLIESIKQKKNLPNIIKISVVWPIIGIKKRKKSAIIKLQKSLKIRIGFFFVFPQKLF